MRIDINAEYNFWKRWLARVQMKKRPPKFSPKTSIHQWLADHLFQKTQSIQCFNKKVCVPTKWLTRDLNLSYLTLHFLPKRLTSSVTLDQSVTCGPQSSHPKRVSYILDLRCVRDCPLFSGEVYISNCPTVFFFTRVHIRQSQAYMCSPLRVTTDNGWIVDLHLCLGSSQVNPALGSLWRSRGKLSAKLRHKTVYLP